MKMPDFVDVGFEDMVEGESGFPMHGIRILTWMDEEGNTWVTWRTSGDPALNDILALLHRGAFLMQMEDYLRTEVEHTHDSIDPDGEDN